MFEFLKRKYPFTFNLVHNAKIVFFVSLVLGVFLYFFQPFDLYSFPPKQKIIFSLSIAVITFAVLAFNMLVLPSYFTKIFTQEKWTVWKEILWNLWLITSISAAYVIFLKIIHIPLIKGVFVLKVILLSVIPISLLVVFNRNRLLRLNLYDAVEMNRKLLQKLRERRETVTLQSEYNETLTLEPDKIILVRAAGNYIEIFYDDNLKAVRKILRITLKRVQEILSKYSFIYRTHRSYLVNVNYITQAEGNSQGIQLKLNLIDFMVPVSRNYIQGLKNLL